MLACACLSNPESSVLESGLTGLEICSLKSCLRSGSADLWGNRFYFIFQSSSGYLVLTAAKCRQIQMKSARVCSCSSVWGPSLFITRSLGQIVTRSWRRSSKAHFQVQFPMDELRVCSQCSSASSHCQGIGLPYHPQICGGNSVIQDYFDIFYVFNRHLYLIDNFRLTC